MDERRRQRVERAIATYRDAINDYDVPITRLLVQSRERLASFVACDLPLMIDRELDILERRCLEAQKASIKTLH